MIRDSFTIERDVEKNILVFQIESERKSLSWIIQSVVDKDTMKGLSPALQRELEAVVGELIQSFGHKVRTGLM